MDRRFWGQLGFFLFVFGSVGFIGSMFTNYVAHAADPPVFTEVTDAVGLHYRDETWGWAWGDYNQDGLLDLFLGHHPALSEPAPHDRDSALMVNTGDGTFVDLIQPSGISLQADRHDQVWVDYDNDGDLDLWITVGGQGGAGSEPNELFRNDGNGQFTDVAQAAGVDYPLARGRGSAWLDFDNDGYLDLYFTSAQRTDVSNALFKNNGNGTFTDVAAAVGLDAFVGANSNVAVADYDADGDPDLCVTGPKMRLYRKDADGFVEVSDSIGMRTSGATGVAWGDYDNDGDVDLFVARGALYRGSDYAEVNGDEIRFVGVNDSGDEDGLDFTASGEVEFYLQQQVGGTVLRTIDIVFLGPDGSHPISNPFALGPEHVTGPPPYTPGTSTGMFVWQSTPGEWHIRWTASGSVSYRFSGIITASGQLGDVTEVGFEPASSYDLPNRLYRNQGNGTFVDVAEAAGVADGLDCRSGDWGDFDNDGYLDLFVQTAGQQGWNAPNFLYHNNGDGTFTNVAAALGISGTDEGYGWGGVWADYDNDGFLDILTSQESWTWPLDNGRYELFHNTGNSNHWLQIQLQGVESNSQGHGAKVWVSAGGVEQYREVADGSHYSQHYTGPVQVGLGDAITVEELRIRWPSGTTQVFTNLAADQRVAVIEDSSPTPTPTFSPTATPTSTPTGTGTPTETQTPTQTATPTETGTPTDTPTPTETPTETATPTETGTPTNTSTPTETATPTGTPTATSSPTSTTIPVETIIDNSDPAFDTEGAWQTDSGDHEQYGDDFVVARSGSGDKSATFTLEIQASGDYELYVWWPECWVCASNAPFTVEHADGSTTELVALNDRQRAGQWNSLGLYPFETGQSASVVLTDDADGRVIADAIRLVWEGE